MMSRLVLESLAAIAPRPNANAPVNALPMQVRRLMVWVVEFFIGLEMTDRGWRGLKPTLLRSAPGMELAGRIAGNNLAAAVDESHTQRHDTDTHGRGHL